jgi:hypothetical protein
MIYRKGLNNRIQTPSHTVRKREKPLVFGNSNPIVAEIRPKTSGIEKSQVKMSETVCDWK